MTIDHAKESAEPKRAGRAQPLRQKLERVMAVALEEFSAHGVDGARAEIIARRAGISKQLLHHYYGSKEELYKLVLESASEASTIELLNAGLDGLLPVDALRHFVFHLFDAYHRDPWLARFTLDQTQHGGVHITERSKIRSLGPKVAEQIEGIIARGVERGDFRDDLETDKVFALILLLPLGQLIGPIIKSFLATDLDSNAGAAPWREFAAEVVISALRPIAPPPGVDDPAVKGHCQPCGGK